MRQNLLSIFDRLRSNSKSIGYSSYWKHLDNVAIQDVYKSREILDTFLRRNIAIGLIDYSLRLGSDKWERKSKAATELMRLTEECITKEVALGAHIKKYLDLFEGLNFINYLGNDTCAPYQTLQYVSMLSPVHTHSHELAHLYFALRVLTISGGTTESLLEIGGGYGGLIEKLLALNLKFKNIFLVDLPENLTLAYQYLSSNILTNRYNVSLKLFDSDENLYTSFPTIYFVPYDLLYNLPKINFVVNTRSLQEMDDSSVAHYFEVIQNKLLVDGIFFNMNRVVKIGSESEGRVFKEFPYDANWQTLYSMPSCNPKTWEFVTRRLPSPGRTFLSDLKSIPPWIAR